MSKRGITLIELILTITLIGILAAMALPRLGGKDYIAQLRLRTTTHQIASDIRYARRLAITNSADYYIKFNFGNNTYDIYDQSETPIGREFPKDIPSGISPSGTQRFIFHRLGNATWLPSASLGTLTLTSGSHSYDITVGSVTGAVMVQ